MVHRINPETPRQNPTTAIGVQTAGRYCQVARVIPAATMNVSMMCLKIISVGLARKGKSGGSGLQDAAKAKGLEESRPQRNSGNSTPRQEQDGAGRRQSQITFVGGLSSRFAPTEPTLQRA